MDWGYMKILLLYPKYPDTFWSFKHSLPFIRSRAAYPPLGLLTVAAMLPSDWDKKLVDMNITDPSDDDIKKADLVFVSAMIVQKQSAESVIKRCQDLGKKVVAGGPLFLSCREQFEHVDHLILGEAEGVLPLFLKDLFEDKAQHVYSSKEYPDILGTPLPLWSLINFKDYATMSIQYSRGCPFDCEFCDIVILNGRVPRTKTPEQLMHEFDALYAAGWRGRIFIVDDNFIGNKSSVIKTLSVLIEWQKKHRYPFAFTTQTSIDLADNPELMTKMSEANFYQVFIGIETPNTESLSECNKKQNLKTDLERSVKIINNNGLQVMGGFIVGFDNDPEKIFDSQIDFIQRSGVVIAMVGMLSALPNTRLWHRLKSENRVLDNTVSGNNVDGETNVVPLIGIKKLKAGYKRVLVEIYSKKNYYKRINTLLKSYRPSVVTTMRSKDLYTLVKAFWKIGVCSKGERRLFWKAILKTTFTKPRALPEVISYAILGTHFHAIVKKL